MPASLVTDFKRVAQSGPTIDGRVIKSEWLTDMAETYDPKRYTAKLWIDHKRFYGAYGSVQALKAIKDGDTTRLLAKISPNRSLLQMNQIWEEKLHFSIEPIEDFAETGKCYLGGLGMTDEPASLGTDEMRFSRNADHKFSARYPGEPVCDLRDINSMNDEQVESFARKFAKFFFNFDKNNPEKNEEPMNEEQSKAFKESLETTQKTVADMEETLKQFMATIAPAPPEGEQATDEDSQIQSADADKFTALQTGLEDLCKKFETLVGRLEQANPGTPFGETPAPAADQDELF